MTFNTEIAKKKKKKKKKKMYKSLKVQYNKSCLKKKLLTSCLFVCTEVTQVRTAVLPWVLYIPTIEPRHEKTNNVVFVQEPYKHRRWLEAGNFGFRKQRNCTILVA